MARPIFESFAAPSLTTREIDVAETIWLAINDTTGQLRFPAGPDAVALWEAADEPADNPRRVFRALFDALTEPQLAAESRRSDEVRLG